MAKRQPKTEVVEIIEGVEAPLVVETKSKQMEVEFVVQNFYIGSFLIGDFIPDEVLKDEKLTRILNNSIRVGAIKLKG